MSDLGIISRAFDERARCYDENRMHGEVADSVAEFSEVSDDDDVLDVATGTGLVLRALRRRHPGLALTGTDLSPGMLAVARKELPGVDLLEGDAARLPLHDDSIDVVTCVTALHIIPDVSAAIAEWRRVLRSGGRVITATFSMVEGTVSDDAVDLGPKRPYPRRHRPFRTLAALGETATAHGFSITRHTDWSDGSDTVLIAEWVPAD